MGYKLKRATIWRDTTRLPSEYQEVEYIQSSGTQYLVIGNSFSTDYKVEIDLQLTATGGDQLLFGCTTTYRFGINAYSSYFKTITGGSSWRNTKSEDANRHTFIMDKGTTYVDGTSYVSSYVSYTYNFGLGLFDYNRIDGGMRFPAKEKLFSCKIYNGSTILYDLVPCYRKSDSEVGMYDIINDVFYTNSGTGTFAKGNDVGGLQEKQVRPTTSPGWQPGANTLAYYPFSSDAIDVIGNTSLSVSGTQETLGRSFNSSVMINTFPSTSVKTSSVWFKVDTLQVTGNVQIFILRTQPGCYMVKDSQYNGAFYMYKNRNYYASAPRTQGQWTNLVITVANNYLVCYKDGVQYTLGSGTLQDAYNQLINISGTCNFVMSDLIFEDATRTQQDVLDYYNLTKGKYGL